MLFFLAACTEYSVDKKDDPPRVGDTAADTSAPDTDTDTTPPDTGDTDGGTVPSTSPCDGVDFGGLLWWGSQPFSTEPDPRDSGGRAFYDAGFDLVGWSTVSLPDSGHNPPGNDRAYRAVFSRPAVDRLFVDLQSDDGIWLYLNGNLVGHWGGEWQEEGCVNDEARCLETQTVAPVEVTRWLQDGDNVLAARVSNAIDNAWFDLHAYCAD
jgi:hypothetical protein